MSVKIWKIGISPNLLGSKPKGVCKNLKNWVIPKIAVIILKCKKKGFYCISKRWRQNGKQCSLWSDFCVSKNLRSLQYGRLFSDSSLNKLLKSFHIFTGLLCVCPFMDKSVFSSQSCSTVACKINSQLCTCYLRCLMTKPTKCLCAQRIHRLPSLIRVFAMRSIGS